MLVGWTGWSPENMERGGLVAVLLTACAALWKAYLNRSRQVDRLLEAQAKVMGRTEEILHQMQFLMTEVRDRMDRQNRLDRSDLN